MRVLTQVLSTRPWAVSEEAFREGVAQRASNIWPFLYLTMSKTGLERNAFQIRKNRKIMQARWCKPQCEAGHLSTEPPEQVTLGWDVILSVLGDFNHAQEAT